MTTLHVIPTTDEFEHDADDDCACGPTPQFVDGGMVIVHHSLDGREQDE